MTSLESTVEPPDSPSGSATPSPCVDVCQLDSDFICIGCGRHIEDIMRWRDMSDAERQAALDRALNS